MEDKEQTLSICAEGSLRRRESELRTDARILCVAPAKSSYDPDQLVEKTRRRTLVQLLVEIFHGIKSSSSFNARADESESFPGANWYFNR
jgi:hypothetical protein